MGKTAGFHKYRRNHGDLAISFGKVADDESFWSAGYNSSATDMRVVFVTITLLSTVMSANFLKIHNLPPHVGERFPLSLKAMKLPQDASLEFGDFSTYEGRRRFRQNRNLRFPGDTIISHINGKERSQQGTLVKSGELLNSECQSPNPTSLLISINLQEISRNQNRMPRDCTTEKCRRQNYDWEIQEPLYVEEPGWVEIENEYSDSVPQQIAQDDPFIVSRGKKLLRDELTGSAFDDYDPRKELAGSDGYGDFDRRGSTRSFVRDRRSSGNGFARREEKQEAATKERKERTHEKQEEDNYRLDLHKTVDPFFLTRGRKNQGKYNWYGKQDTKNTFEPNEKYSSPKEHPGEPADSLKNIDFKLGKENFSRYPSVNSLKKNEYRSETGVENEFVAKSREKRNACKDRCVNELMKKDANSETREDDHNQWVKDFRKSILDMTFVERRDEHSDLLDILEEPFFISRGKKAFNEFAKPEHFDNQELMNKFIAKDVLNTLIKTLKCNGENCVNDHTEELLKYDDPFYAVRGKKSILNLLEGTTQNPRISSFKPSDVSREKPSFGVRKNQWDFVLGGKRTKKLMVPTEGLYSYNVPF